MAKLRAEEIDVVLLCGGKGERLRSVLAGKPKPLATINGRPFLDILIDYLRGLGFKRVILCIGYKADLIKQHYKQRKESLGIIFSEEKEPLGTAGAVKNAQRHIKSNPFLVMNGDSFCNLDFNDFINFYVKNGAFFSIALVNGTQAADYGFVSLAGSGEIISFEEKPGPGKKGLMNAGIYLFDKSLFSLLPAGKNVSLEYDVLPKIVNKGFFGYPVNASLLDIGTPQRYKQAINFFNKDVLA